jgi:DNA polymerase III delta prime subunit
MTADTVLWVDRFKPKWLKDYVWQNEQTEKQVKSWVTVGASDNVLLYGPAGVGKTTLASVLLNELKIDKSDTLWMNASREGNIEEMRTKVHSFISTGGWSGMKYVIFDEADGLTQRAQEALRADMEEYSNSVRWILTANHVNKLTDAIRDRCTKIEISKPDRDSYELRMIQILRDRGIEIDDVESATAFENIVKRNYPSLRGCIRDLQRYSSSGKLEIPTTSSVGSDWRYRAMELMKRKQIKEARQLLCSEISADEIEEVYRWLYKNSTELFPSSEEEAIIIVANHLVDHAVVADAEINLAACMAKLGRL